MDRDEAIARGLRVHETQHSMKRRSPWHDYHGRGTYMLTLVVEGRMPLLGKLWGRVDARPGDGDAPKVMLSELGIAIAKEEIPKIHKYYPQVEVWRVCIMPDHIHLIVRVKEDLRGGQAMESLGTGAREERLEAKERVENRKEKRSFFIKSCTKKERNLDFLLRIMLKMLHFNANRNLFCNFVLRTAVITKFSFPKI